MIYFQYTNSRLSQKSKSGKIRIPVSQEVFDSYGSGANQQSSSVIKKYSFIAVFLFLLLALSMYGARKYISPSQESNESDSNTNQTQQKDLQSQRSKATYTKYSHIEDKQPYIIYCLPKECLINGNFYTYDYMKFLVENYDIKLIASNSINITKFRKFYLYSSTDDYKKLFTVRSKEDEKETINKPSFT